MTTFPPIPGAPGVTAMEVEAADATADDVLSQNDPPEPCVQCVTCEQHAFRLNANLEEQEQAELAAATYEPNAPLPEGYKRATQADLERLQLVDDDTNVLELEGHPDFHAETFVRTDPETGERSYVIGFRGTTNWDTQRWQNYLQTAGWLTDYYKQAATIGTRVRMSGEPATFVGHSLGGGLASAASGASGLKAQTFNSAGLSQRTLNYVPFESPDLVSSTHVRGEIVSLLQDKMYLVPEAYGIRRHIPPGLLNREPRVGRSLKEHFLIRSDYSEKLHLMVAVQSALKEEERYIRSEMDRLGCGKLGLGTED